MRYGLNQLSKNLPVIANTNRLIQEQVKKTGTKIKDPSFFSIDNYQSFFIKPYYILLKQTHKTACRLQIRLF